MYKNDAFSSYGIAQYQITEVVLLKSDGYEFLFPQLAANTYYPFDDRDFRLLRVLLLLGSELILALRTPSPAIHASTKI